MGKGYSTILCEKPFLSHISCLFLYIHLSQVDNMFFFCFMKFQTFGGAEGTLIIYIFIFMWLVFPLKIHKNSTKTTLFR